MAKLQENGSIGIVVVLRRNDGIAATKERAARIDTCI